jgi:hypothetical protein
MERWWLAHDRPVSGLNERVAAVERGLRRECPYPRPGVGQVVRGVLEAGGQAPPGAVDEVSDEGLLCVDQGLGLSEHRTAAEVVEPLLLAVEA